MKCGKLSAIVAINAMPAINDSLIHWFNVYYITITVAYRWSL